MSRKNKRSHLSRRQFLKISTATLGGLLLPRRLGALAAPIHQKLTIRPHFTPQNGPIIADHTIVDQYSEIPQAYIDLVKEMWATIPGESHSAGYRAGCELLEAADSRFQVNVNEWSAPEGPTDQYLRLSRATWGDVNHETGWIFDYGEEDWYTSAQAVQRTKAHLTYCNTNNLEIAAMGFAWCWDTSSPEGTGSIDPVHQCRWGGKSVTWNGTSLVDLGGWGLDPADSALTGNSICMDTYLLATQEYIDYCQSNGYPTKIFYTTSPVDSNRNIEERGYQRWLKNEYIRQHILGVNSGILFDYGDILCWNASGQQQTTSWTDHGGTLRTYPIIHDDNEGDYAGSHIGEAGCLRLGKALWWMLARIAGWDGASSGDDTIPPSIPTGLQGTAKSFSEIDLSWDASSDNPGGTGVAGYRIYRNSEQIGTSLNTEFSDSGLSANTYYTYTVTAYDGAGNTSDPSTAITVKTPAVPFKLFIPLAIR